MSEFLDILANPSFWVAVLRIATPLILGTLGVLLCERAGVLNLGIEGTMVAGAFTGWLAVYAGAPLWGGVLAFAGGRRGRGAWVLSAERSVYAVFGLLIVSSGAIIAAFVRNEYGYKYVAGYSNRELSLFYKITGLWAGQTGSLVFWALLLALFASIVVWQNRRTNREFMPYVSGTLLVVLAFFLGVVLFGSNPFQLMDFTPADGRGLNPQLQNYWMTIHPPTLYLGFTAFTVPFAFAVAALISGRLDTRWITTTRRWTLLAWFFLTNGIIIGMMWAYVELGWGGYWFWDPVENASLMPWLAGTALLPVIRYSVLWWNTLHQGPSIGLARSSIDPSILWPLWPMAAGLSSLFGAIVLMRMRADLARIKAEARLRRRAAA